MAQEELKQEQKGKPMEAPKKGGIPGWGKGLIGGSIAIVLGVGAKAAHEKGVLPEVVDNLVDAGEKIAQKAPKSLANASEKVLEKMGVTFGENGAEEVNKNFKGGGGKSGGAGAGGAWDEESSKIGLENQIKIENIGFKEESLTLKEKKWLKEQEELYQQTVQNQQMEGRVVFTRGEKGLGSYFVDNQDKIYLLRNVQEKIVLEYIPKIEGLAAMWNLNEKRIEYWDFFKLPGRLASSEEIKSGKVAGAEKFLDTQSWEIKEVIDK